MVSVGRKIIGATNPAASEPGTIRFDYAIEVGGLPAEGGMHGWLGMGHTVDVEGGDCQPAGAPGGSGVPKHRAKRTEQGRV